MVRVGALPTRVSFALDQEPGLEEKPLSRPRLKVLSPYCPCACEHVSYRYRRAVMFSSVCEVFFAVVESLPTVVISGKGCIVWY